MARQRAAKCSSKRLAEALVHAPGERRLPRPVPLGRVCVKRGETLSPFFCPLLSTPTLPTCNSAGSNLGWRLSSEVVICLAVAVLQWKDIC